jgi:hypothetical protein
MHEATPGPGAYDPMMTNEGGSYDPGSSSLYPKGAQLVGHTSRFKPTHIPDALTGHFAPGIAQDLTRDPTQYDPARGREIKDTASATFNEKGQHGKGGFNASEASKGHGGSFFNTASENRSAIDCVIARKRCENLGGFFVSKDSALPECLGILILGSDTASLDGFIDSEISGGHGFIAKLLLQICIFRLQLAISSFHISELFFSRLFASVSSLNLLCKRSGFTKSSKICFGGFKGSFWRFARLNQTQFDQLFSHISVIVM